MLHRYQRRFKKCGSAFGAFPVRFMKVGERIRACFNIPPSAVHHPPSPNGWVRPSAQGRGIRHKGFGMGVSKVFGFLVSLPIRAYRLFLSPLLPPSCRFQPTCSVYALEAIAVHGPVRGLWLALRRILRCHPVTWLGGGSGFDPVPPVKVGRRSEENSPDDRSQGHKDTTLRG